MTPYQAAVTRARIIAPGSVTTGAPMANASYELLPPPKWNVSRSASASRSSAR